MKCPNCKSDNVEIHFVAEVKTKKKRRGVFYWLFIGWWLELILWFFFTVPRLFIALFMPKKTETVTQIAKAAICQNCGNSWSVK